MVSRCQVNQQSYRARCLRRVYFLLYGQSPCRRKNNIYLRADEHSRINGYTNNISLLVLPTGSVPLQGNSNNINIKEYSENNNRPIDKEPSNTRLWIDACDHKRDVREIHENKLHRKCNIRYKSLQIVKELKIYQSSVG